MPKISKNYLESNQEIQKVIETFDAEIKHYNVSDAALKNIKEIQMIRPIFKHIFFFIILFLLISCGQTKRLPSSQPKNLEKQIEEDPLVGRWKSIEGMFNNMVAFTKQDKRVKHFRSDGTLSCGQYS